ncbi:hypothetical protein BDK51DRAFT_39880 [Blyttiomyces helicus]|uniref:Uncharacterized protein n=1 Tax=Blyttiomyces helicus TaxID=388810 RepID=A0A4P9W452_9FUNG|nr:hypothetical protein BDK51DRAFT_39880 [Blyttiomyces helicus]|eukprot:RKO86652.1 hypothetical protein BDK51DRAFT_39880 [Blyttiomyces helicus]
MHLPLGLPTVLLTARPLIPHFTVPESDVRQTSARQDASDSRSLLGGNRYAQEADALPAATLPPSAQGENEHRRPPFIALPKPATPSTTRRSIANPAPAIDAHRGSYHQDPSEVRSFAHGKRFTTAADAFPPCALPKLKTAASALFSPEKIDPNPRYSTTPPISPFGAPRDPVRFAPPKLDMRSMSGVATGARMNDGYIPRTAPLSIEQVLMEPLSFHPDRFLNGEADEPVDVGYWDACADRVANGFDESVREALQGEQGDTIEGFENSSSVPNSKGNRDVTKLIDENEKELLRQQMELNEVEPTLDYMRDDLVSFQGQRRVPTSSFGSSCAGVTSATRVLDLTWSHVATLASTLNTWKRATPAPTVPEVENGDIKPQEAVEEARVADAMIVDNVGGEIEVDGGDDEAGATGETIGPCCDDDDEAVIVLD